MVTRERLSLGGGLGSINADHDHSCDMVTRGRHVPLSYPNRLLPAQLTSSCGALHLWLWLHLNKCSLRPAPQGLSPAGGPACIALPELPLEVPLFPRGSASPAQSPTTYSPVFMGHGLPASGSARKGDTVGTSTGTISALTGSGRGWEGIHTDEDSRDKETPGGETWRKSWAWAGVTGSCVGAGPRGGRSRQTWARGRGPSTQLTSWSEGRSLRP